MPSRGAPALPTTSRIPVLSTHERIAREETVSGGSDRSFGLVFAGFFTLLTLLKLWKGWSESGWVYLGLAVAFLLRRLNTPPIGVERGIDLV